MSDCLDHEWNLKSSRTIGSIGTEGTRNLNHCWCIFDPLRQTKHASNANSCGLTGTLDTGTCDAESTCFTLSHSMCGMHLITSRLFPNSGNTGFISRIIIGFLGSTESSQIFITGGVSMCTSSSATLASALAWAPWPNCCWPWEKS